MQPGSAIITRRCWARSTFHFGLPSASRTIMALLNNLQGKAGQGLGEKKNRTFVKKSFSQHRVSLCSHDRRPSDIGLLQLGIMC
jgi:hypothetical protein